MKFSDEQISPKRVAESSRVNTLLAWRFSLQTRGQAVEMPSKFLETLSDRDRVDRRERAESESELRENS